MNIINNPVAQAGVGVLVLSVLAFSLIKMENYRRRGTNYGTMEGMGSRNEIRKVVNGEKKKRYIYQGNPAFDFELQDIRVSGAHRDYSHEIVNVYGPRNVISSDPHASQPAK